MSYRKNFFVVLIYIFELHKSIKCQVIPKRKELVFTVHGTNSNEKKIFSKAKEACYLLEKKLAIINRFDLREFAKEDLEKQLAGKIFIIFFEKQNKINHWVSI